MSILKIKDLANEIKSGKLIQNLKTDNTYGSNNPRKILVELFDLIEEYKEPNPEVDTPPKPKTRRTRTPRKDNTTE